ncbi:MAG: hypothetical protein QOJ15_1806 [Bradyrhizobium sp.]|jgi:hypothetical protein|nr:hypothetical protein [Bradyrhizobium sp.]
MTDVIFLLVAIAFVIVALGAIATLNRSPTVRWIANRVIYGSCIAALISAALAVWFFH